MSLSLSIPIFSRMALSISIFSKMTISISIFSIVSIYRKSILYTDISNRAIQRWVGGDGYFGTFPKKSNLVYGGITK